MIDHDNPLIKVVFHFQDGVTLQLYMPEPVSQMVAMPAIGMLCAKLKVNFREVMGFGMDTVAEKWEVTPEGCELTDKERTTES